MAMPIEKPAFVLRRGRKFVSVGRTTMSRSTPVVRVDDATARKLAADAVRDFIAQRDDDHMSEDDLRPTSSCLAARVDY